MIVTRVPTIPLVGAKLATAGTTPMTVKFVVLTPVPLAVVTDHAPVVAPSGGTVAVMLVSEFTVKVTAGVPWNGTAVAPVKWAVMATTEPVPPEWV